MPIEIYCEYKLWCELVRRAIFYESIDGNIIRLNWIDRTAYFETRSSLFLLLAMRFVYILPHLFIHSHSNYRFTFCVPGRSFRCVAFRLSGAILATAHYAVLHNFMWFEHTYAYVCVRQRVHMFQTQLYFSFKYIFCRSILVLIMFVRKPDILSPAISSPNTGPKRSSQLWLSGNSHNSADISETFTRTTTLLSAWREQVMQNFKTSKINDQLTDFQVLSDLVLDSCRRIAIPKNIHINMIAQWNIRKWLYSVRRITFLLIQFGSTVLYGTRLDIVEPILA